MKFIFLFLILSSCSHKIIGKNCKWAVDPFKSPQLQYADEGDKHFVCDSLNGLGR